MKIRVFILILISSLICLGGFSQSTNRIKINDDIELIQLSENAYLHVSYSEAPGFGRFPSNGFVFIQNQKAFLFDTPVTFLLTQILVSWLHDSLHVSVVGFVPNHWHNDCMSGMGYLQSTGIKSWANQMTIDKAIAENLPVPDVGFTDSLILNLDDKIIKCFYFGAAHSLDNIVVWIPSEKILFAGCMAKEIYSKNLGNTVDSDLQQYPSTIAKVIAHFPDAEIVIPGHGSFGGIELLKHTQKLLEK
ncbi:MAG: subclass B1 metallo-beta-lactamase CfiA4 [Bacteroidetes bacterium GWF2_33_16]|nr:MAG: subclass B1 metallo-beta-lactamase CfiA4 [Bacteroidetes bacterium GWE2_32_14]OFY08659.1 MAG: subclass B1 metallo-beta-lactamase CfiA4 [Bacteroidetes bacterium GWF2_33_16]